MYQLIGIQPCVFWGFVASLLVLSVFLPEKILPTARRSTYSTIVILILACLMGMKGQSQMAILICSVVLIYGLCKRYGTWQCQTQQEKSKNTLSD
jgi:hypothetical protein